MKPIKRSKNFTHDCGHETDHSALNDEFDILYERVNRMSLIISALTSELIAAKRRVAEIENDMYLP